MPSLKAIRKRIVSVKNTRKMTRAMKLISAAKLRRAQDAIIAARPYAAALTKVVSELAAVAGTDAHKLFQVREVKKAAIVLLTTDRGQAGAFNANVIKKTESLVENELGGATEISLRIIGKKGNQYFKRRNANIASHDATPTNSESALVMARETANRIIDDFLHGRVDRVYVVYNEFKSAISQGVVAHQVLPVAPDEVITPKPDAHAEPVATDYEYEPSKETLLSSLVPLYVEIGLYRAGLESIASEHGARMSSMDNATRNAGEMIDKLTLDYNRARQAAITKELLEIIGGAEALKG